MRASNQDPTPRPGRLSGPFVVGLNLPWVHYGCDFGANTWQPAGGLSQPARRRALDDHLAQLADSPVACLRWFLLCDGRAGLSQAEAGDDLRLDSRVLADLDVALEALARHRLNVMFVLFDFLWCSRPRRERGVTLGGRRHWLFHNDLRARLIDGVVVPLVSHCADHQAVWAWDVMNEPDWLVRWQRLHAWRWAASPATMARTLAEIVGAVRAHAPQPVTVGLASDRGLELVRGLGLDFYQVHWYDRFGLDAVLCRSVASLALDRPVVLGEFPSRDTAVGQATVIGAARRLGYAGAFAWSLLADDPVSARVPPPLGV